jgi:hypothetical protein
VTGGSRTASLAHRCAVVVIAFVVAGCTRAMDTRVTRHEVAIHLRSDGVAEIEETLHVRPDAGSEPIERRIAARQSDGLEFAGASIDGAPAAADAVVVDARATTLRIQWRLPDGREGAHVVGVRYRAVGVLSVHGRRGQFEWPAVPRERRQPLDSARVTLSVPADVVRVGEWGLAEAGWTVTASTDELSATRNLVAPGVGGTVLAEVAVDPSRLGEPRWQQEADLARQLTPAFIAGGLFLLTIGAGVLWIIRFEASSRHRSGPAEAARADRDRRRTAEGLYIAGLVCLVFAVVAAGVTYFVLSRYGPWAMAIPVSIVLVAVMFLIAGERRGDRGAPRESA